MVKLGVASAAGALQPFLIKKYIITGTNDVNYIPQLPYEMGKLSNLVNNGAGIAAIAAAIAGMYRKGPAVLRQSDTQMMLLAYGVPALAIGLAMNFGLFTATGQSFRAGPSMSVRGQPFIQHAMPQQPPRIYGQGASTQKFL